MQSPDVPLYCVRRSVVGPDAPMGFLKFLGRSTGVRAELDQLPHEPIVDSATP